MNTAMILAGGSGTRMGLEIPKQFVEVNGKPLIIYTIEAFQRNRNIDAIVMVCRDDYREKLKNWTLEYGLNKVKVVASNGDTRQSSVENGLAAAEGFCVNSDIILIHDGARPLISDDIIDRNIEGAKKFKAVNTVVPCTDTLIKSTGGSIIEDVKDRSVHYLCQTPQSFEFGIIKEAHEFAKTNDIGEATDDSQLVSKMGCDVHLVMGSKLNFKVTTMDDLIIFKAVAE